MKHRIIIAIMALLFMTGCAEEKFDITADYVVVEIIWMGDGNDCRYGLVSAKNAKKGRHLKASFKPIYVDVSCESPCIIGKTMNLADRRIDYIHGGRE